MQRQVVLAAFLASANAGPARPDCTAGKDNTDLTMQLASRRIKAATDAIADLTGKKKTQDELVATELGLKKAAAEAYSKWQGLVSELDAQGKAGAKNKTDLAANLAAAEKGIADLNKVTVGPLTKAKKATTDAKKKVTDQEALIAAAKINCEKLAAAVKEHDKQAADAVTALATAKKAFDDAKIVSEAAKATWSTANDLKTKGNPNVLKVEDGTSGPLKTTASNATNVGDTAISPGTGTTGAPTIYNAEYIVKATPAIGYKTIHTAKLSISDTKFGTWKTEAGKLEEAEQLYTKLNGLCTVKGQKATNASADKTCTTLMSGYAEWYKQQALISDHGASRIAAKGTAAITAVTAVPAAGKPGDMTWTNVKLDTTASLTQNASTYAAEVKVVNVGNLAAGTGYYATRDAAYILWLAAADVTADAQKKWDLAKVEKSKLDCLATSSDAHTSAVNGVACESQTKKIKDLKATRDSKGTITGAVDANSLNAASGTWVVAALPAGTGKLVTAGGINEPKDDVITAAQITAATGPSKLKTYMQAARDKEVSAEHKRQSGLDSAAAIKAKEALEAPLAALKATVSVKEYLEKIESDKEAVFKADKVKYENAKLKKHRDDEATQALESATYATNASKAYAADAGTTLAAWNLATARSTALGSQIKAQTTEKTNAEAALKLATSNCKAAGYQAAQDALAALTTQKKADQKAYDALKTSYKKAAILKPLDPNPDGKASPVGTDCSIPVKDGVAGARPVCAEKLCCGAATKFLRDGTRLAIETCQTATDLTYTYYPPLPKTVVTKAPAPETWRFTCISGAKNLAATATAALAAAYLMA